VCRLLSCVALCSHLLTDEKKIAKWREGGLMCFPAMHHFSQHLGFISTWRMVSMTIIVFISIVIICSYDICLFSLSVLLVLYFNDVCVGVLVLFLCLFSLMAARCIVGLCVYFVPLFLPIFLTSPFKKKKRTRKSNKARNLLHQVNFILIIILLSRNKDALLHFAASYACSRSVVGQNTPPPPLLEEH
jgi:hypothetical protein